MSSLIFRTVAELENLGQASLQTGPFGTQLKASEYVEEGIPVINVRNIGFGEVRKEDLEYVNEAKAEKLHQHRLRKGDIVFGRKGAVERHALIDDNVDGWIQGSDCLRLRIWSPDVCERYLSHYLKTQAHQDWMQALCSFGATMTSLNQDIVRRISFPAPPIEVQKRIAATLTAYDELIENNQRRIALLEKMAEEIYREWFVRLRFPGHEKVRVIKGVPDGWEVRTLASFASEIKKGVKKKNLSDDEIYVGLEHIPRRSISIKEWATGDSVESNKLMFQERDILFCKIRPYLHKVALSHVAGACSSDTIVIRPKNRIYEAYLLFTVFSDTFIELATIASKGTKMPRADWGFLKKLELTVPSTQLLDAYQGQFNTLFAQIVNLLRSNEVLVSARDALLPRLISGKLFVEDLDIQFPPGMAEAASVA